MSLETMQPQADGPYTERGPTDICAVIETPTISQTWTLRRTQSITLSIQGNRLGSPTHLIFDGGERIQPWSLDRGGGTDCSQETASTNI